MESPTPTEALRRRAMQRLLAAFATALILFHVARRFTRVVDPPHPFEPPPPMAVDLATDPAERLLFLPGIGPARAAAIVQDRRRRGPIEALEALVRVHGIGPETVHRIRTSTEVSVEVLGRVPPARK